MSGGLSVIRGTCSGHVRVVAMLECSVFAKEAKLCCIPPREPLSRIRFICLMYSSAAPFQQKCGHISQEDEIHLHVQEQICETRRPEYLERSTSRVLHIKFAVQLDNLILDACGSAVLQGKRCDGLERCRSIDPRTES